MYDWRKWTLWCLIQANWYKSDEKYVSELGIGYKPKTDRFWREDNRFLSRLRSKCETIGVTISGDGGGVNISG